MPTYVYKCRDCGSRFDAMRRMSERADAPRCPQCDSEHTELALSAPFVAGGSGGGAGGGSCNSWTGGG